MVASSANGVVDWFDHVKGYGFVNVEELGQSAFLHVSVLEKSGIGEVHDGDALIVDVSRNHKGIAISRVRKADATATKLLDAVVIKMFEERGYGFVYVPSLGRDAFFHISILPEDERAAIAVGERFEVEINADVKGRGLQVRRVARTPNASGAESA